MGRVNYGMVAGSPTCLEVSNHEMHALQDADSEIPNEQPLTMTQCGCQP